MKKMVNKILSLTLTLLTILSLGVSTAAADGSHIIADTEIHFTTVNQAVDGDLFDNFKGVMPGDKLVQKITFVNNTGVDKLTLKLVGVPHDETNPIHDAVDAKWQGSNDVLADMNAFLSKMMLTIYSGDTTDGTPLVPATNANEILSGVNLENIAIGESVILTVVLDVDINMGNEFQDRAGEIDWQFIAEGFSYNKIQVQKVWDDHNYSKRPKEVKIYLTRNGVRTGDYVILNEGNDWKAIFDELDDRYTWYVEEDTVPGYDAPQYIDGGNGLIFVKNHRDKTTPNIPWYPRETEPPETEPPETEPVETEPEETEPEETKPEETEPEETEPDETEPPETEPELRDLTVKKAWAEDNAEDRPTSVTVVLYCGENEVEKVVLGDWNNWSYTWCDLDAAEQWSVIEVEIPLGYTPSYAADGDTVTITNSAILIQTGQLSWPIPVFGGLGLLCVVGGVLLMRKRKNEDA